MEEAHLSAATVRRVAMLMVGLLMILGSVFASSTHHPATLRLVESNGASADR